MHRPIIVSCSPGEVARGNKINGLGASKLRAYLNAGADAVGSNGRDPYYGNGRVNALRSVSQ